MEIENIIWKQILCGFEIEIGLNVTFRVNYIPPSRQNLYPRLQIW